MSWVGGKKALRDAIVARLDERCDRYVEVFGGGGWVLFHKRPSKFEVYNDFNGTLVNLYRCVRDHPDELCEEYQDTGYQTRRILLPGYSGELRFGA